MGNIKIIKGVFDTKLELEHAGIAAGFPSPADEYRHETLDFNRDYVYVCSTSRLQIVESAMSCLIK